MPSVLVIEIDGSEGEGGGQIIRTAVALSAVTGKPFKVVKIRSNRPRPGLMAQHLASIQAVARLCQAKVEGGIIGSTEVVFTPKGLVAGHLDIDVGTAGAVTLVLQSLMVPAVHAGKSLEFRVLGGTHVKFAPTMEYFTNVFSFFMAKMGVKVGCEIVRHGFYPKGGGEVKVVVSPGKLKPLTVLERGKPLGNTAFSIATADLEKAKVAERQLEGACRVMGFQAKDAAYANALSTGSSVFCGSAFANTILGNDSLGERGMKAEDVGKDAALGLEKQLETGACLDRHMADQILPYMALASGLSSVSVAEVSGHCRTNMGMIEKFLPVKFKVSGNVISVEGSGLLS